MKKFPGMEDNQSEADSRPHKGELVYLEGGLVHGSNISTKESQAGKASKAYGDERSQELISEVREKYDEWKRANMELKGPYSEPGDNDEEIINRRTELLNEYKDFIESKVYAEHFDSRSNLQSTVLEEFFVYLFGDMVSEFSKYARVGKSRTFVDLFFRPGSYDGMTINPSAVIENKDQDFTIGVDINTTFTTPDEESVADKHSFGLPAVTIECKTYVDKTMLGEISRSAETVISNSPQSLYLVACERIKLTDGMNVSKLKMDQVYILRKQINKDRKYRLMDDYEYKPIYKDVVNNIFEKVRSHITRDWEKASDIALQTGSLMPE